MTRAAITQVGSVRRFDDGRVLMRNWEFDAQGDKGIACVTYERVEGTMLVRPVAFCGWPIDELEQISRENVALQFGLVKPTDFGAEALS